MSDDGVKIEQTVDPSQVTEEIPTPTYSVTEVVSGLFDSTTSFIETNGWFLFFGAILAYYAWTVLKKQWDEKYSAEGSAPLFKNSQNDKKYSEEEGLERLEKIQLARERQQAALDAAKEKYLLDKQKKDEELAQARISDWDKHEQGLGYRSKTKRSDGSDPLEQMGLSAKSKAAQKQKTKLRGSDYNPLTGESSTSGGDPDGGSCSWRPSRNTQPARGG